MGDAFLGFGTVQSLLPAVLQTELLDAEDASLPCLPYHTAYGLRAL
jgi:hypothetical protein